MPCAVFESPVRRELDELAIQKIAEREKQVEDGALGLDHTVDGRNPAPVDIVFRYQMIDI